MALANLAVTCGYYGEDPHQNDILPTLGRFQWSENFAAGTSTKAVPVQGSGKAILRIVAAAASWVAVGPVPDASQAVSTVRQNTRHYVPAASGSNPFVDIYAEPGDKIAWIAA